MDQEIATPKFLSPGTAREIVSLVLGMCFDTIMEPQFKRKQCHITILVPDRDGNPHMLCEYSLNEELWEWSYRLIARSKAKQLWEDRNDGGTDIVPHLLFNGDTPYWGGVKRQGIVVACSGVQPWFDKMISGIIADMLIAMAYEAWDKSKDKKDDVCFIGESE
ncbi:MAG: hypothetical protein JWN50_107 [Parcubacteria group bacterium]|nr:hypothetical protein [Parcubacteria group bacterium]